MTLEIGGIFAGARPPFEAVAGQPFIDADAILGYAVRCEAVFKALGDVLSA
jgi:hypothetical protein